MGYRVNRVVGALIAAWLLASCGGGGGASGAGGPEDRELLNVGGGSRSETDDDDPNDGKHGPGDPNSGDGDGDEDPGGADDDAGGDHPDERDAGPNRYVDASDVPGHVTDAGGAVDPFDAGDVGPIEDAGATIDASPGEGSSSDGGSASALDAGSGSGAGDSDSGSSGGYEPDVDGGAGSGPGSGLDSGAAADMDGGPGSGSGSGSGADDSGAGSGSELDSGTGAGDPDPGTAVDGGSEVDGAVASSSDAGSGVEGGGDAAADSGSGPAPCQDGVTSQGAIVADVRVLINEVVAFPLQDWSHTSTNGSKRFTSPAGTGLVDGTDQFVELYNAGTRTIDMRGWTMEMRDTSPSTTTIGVTAGSYYIASSGSSLSALVPGGYLVIGNPNGFASTDAYYVLRSPCGVLADDVEIGGLTASRDAERDGLTDGAPSTGRNSRARGAFDESVARYPNGADTNDDIVDFEPLFATPLAKNEPPPISPTDHSAPVLTPLTTGTNLPVTTPITLSFDETVDGWTADEAVSVTANGENVLLGLADFASNDKKMILNPVGRLPYGSLITVTVDGIHDRAGNASGVTSFAFTTEDEPGNSSDVVINEIVCTPQQDWGGNDFTGIPGDEGGESDDEWLELVNLRPGVTDLSGYSVTIYTGPNNFTLPRVTFTLEAATVASGTVVRVFGGGDSIYAVEQGDYIVIGNPPGSLLTDVYLELRDEDGQLVDTVEVGGNAEEQDRGGNGIDNGAPAPRKDGNSSGLDNEAVARGFDGVDTGSDVNDFCYSVASMGEPNGGCTSY